MSTWDTTRHEIQELLQLAPSDFGGGCTPEKAHVLLWLIKHGRLTTSCDIGVYRGRSLFPQALAHRKYTGGVAFGIDPYTKAAAKQDDNPVLKAQLDQWAATTDFEGLYRGVLDSLGSRVLMANAQLLRMTSREAVDVLKLRAVTFGLIHVDGNHDSDEVVHDVRNYLPLLQPNGFLVLDDISWDSVRPAVRIASAQLRQLYQHVDTANDYAVFWNGRSPLRAAYLAAMLRRIGRV
jgi:hypothetical protein